ncbi:uncharacterized protein B0P05DRAFT_546478 [Gilbertella persicaria]|uniref:uncharacterized protein n=1 Tax=Gilbertella persicaria TaxID=101096 RepID=UPI0022202339|nr:uncharacterized protein B0P05DRAFT_546478 [Gilbertella persicaria]KAI8075806.1 hypothetical protein B0P05DRAFT_546478 [Gilbertella persicaria]
MVNFRSIFVTKRSVFSTSRVAFSTGLSTPSITTLISMSTVISTIVSIIPPFFSMTTAATVSIATSASAIVFVSTSFFFSFLTFVN